MLRSGLSLVMAALLLQAPAARAAQLDKESCTKLKTEQTQLEQGGTRGSLGKGPEWAKVNLAPEKLEQVRRLIEVDEQLLFRCGGRPLVLLPSDADVPAEGKDSPKAPPAKAAKPPAADKKPPAAEKKAPDAEKKKAVPQKRAAPPPQIAPPVVEPAKAAGPSMPVLPGPPPAAAPVPPAAAAPANEVAKATPPAVTAPSPAAPTPAAGPTPSVESATEAGEKKAAALKAAKAKAKKKADDAYRPSAPDWTVNPFAGLLAPAPAKK